MRKKIKFLKEHILLIIVLFVFLISASYSISIIITNQQEINLKNNQLESIKTQINDYNQQTENTINKIDILKNQTTQLKDPTYKEALSFILNDTTNENVYNDTKYNCVHFSADVNNNADKEGLRCAYVEIILEYNYPHAIIAFNTTDEGLVFFEPQLDKIVDMRIGKDYWTDCVGNSTNHGFGNTIMEYILYW
jgi:hypothetical protein